MILPAFRRFARVALVALALLPALSCKDDTPRSSDGEKAAGDAPAGASAAIRPGQPAPAWQLPRPDGSTLDFASFRGKPVLVVFWATWCAPCLQEIPELVKLRGDFSARGFEIVGISIDENPATVPIVVQRRGIAYPVAVQGQPLFDELGLQELPLSYLVDRQGTIRNVFRGFHRYEEYAYQLKKIL